MVSGRDFTHADATNAQHVVIVNETTAATYWPDGGALGSRIKLGDINSNADWMTVVGVAADVRHFGLDAVPRREIFRPYSQAAWPVMTIAVKSASDPFGLATAVREALRRIDPDQPVSRVRTMNQVVDESVGARRFPMLLLGLFAAVALLLAAVGVYGVVSYAVAQRTREIGIRMALGARHTTVVRSVVTRAAVPIAIGLIAGAFAANLAAGQLTGLLFQVEPTDPVVLVSISLLLGAVAIAASWVPAWKAAGVDPVQVLRET
jgi:putative ABC transport system permease protein